jgi:hypothetical protein
MDIVGEIISDPRYKLFIKQCLKEIQEESPDGMQEVISEVEAMKILAMKGAPPSARTMGRYRAEGYKDSSDKLPYIPGRPITYIRKDVYDWRNRNFVIKRV